MKDGLAFLIAWFMAVACMMVWGLIESGGGLKELKAEFIKHGWPIIKMILAGLFIFLVIYKSLSIFVVPA
ncbi:TPA: hypothetical protein ON323_005459 [Serratia marcescens]|nr:hypothetical protein [Serratia marcescens]HCR3026312.1 hypothetical protein [Serratia marcescens]